MGITVIALTGGPCGGKSTSISVLEQLLTEKGYTVFVIEESATSLIKSGLTPGVVGLLNFQSYILDLQVSKENLYMKAAKELRKQGKDVVIICDRGVTDCKAYVSDEEYRDLLEEIHLDEVAVMDFYDGVFHLVTAADGAIEAYTCENNTARTETPEQAIEKDKECIRAWTGHPHLRIIENKGITFEEKINKLVDEVYTLLGIPVPVEIERKFLIEKPDMNKLSQLYNCITVDIIQTYLVEKEDGVERRVRQRGINGNYTFYYTEKQHMICSNSISRIEREKKITKEEYFRLLMEADTSLHQIKKQRTCFVADGAYYELDIYPFWKDKAILEIELTKESDEIIIPKELNIIEEVTDSLKFKNKSLAKNNGKI